MRLPRICLDGELAKYLEQYRSCFSKPQYKYFVIILLGIVLNQSGFTLSGILRQVSAEVTMSGASRFMSQAPWSASEVCQQWQANFRIQMMAKVVAEHRRQKAKQPKRPGRPRKTVVTGYLIGDDSVMQKRRGKKMGGLGHHYSATAEKTVRGHCLVQGLYVLLGRQCLLEPKLYRQKAVCEKEGLPFASKIELMIDLIGDFVPVSNTQTHVLLDSWYAAKKVWQAARSREFLITCGIRNNRSLRIADPSSDKGWKWQKLSTYANSLDDNDFVLTPWPRGERQVYVHIVDTRIKKLYRCQLICIREKLDGKTKFWASSDLAADPQTLLVHIAQRWDIEVLFADLKELLGIDHYQLISAKAIHRFWVLAMVAYGFLEQQRAALRLASARHITIGDASRHVQRTHWAHFLDWLHHHFVSQRSSASDLYSVILH